MDIKHSSLIEQLLKNIYAHSCDMRDAFQHYVEHSDSVLVAQLDNEVMACAQGIAFGALAQEAKQYVYRVNSQPRPKGFGCSYFFRGDEKEIINLLNKIIWKID